MKLSKGQKEEIDFRDFNNHPMIIKILDQLKKKRVK